VFNLERRYVMGGVTGSCEVRVMTLEVTDVNDGEWAPEFGVIDVGPRIRLIKVACELDMLTAPTLRQILGQELRLRPHGVIIDLSKCRLLGAQGLRVLETAHQETVRGTWLVLAGACGFISRTLRMTDLDTVVRSYPSVDDALNGLRHDP
jgi:anti-anti-sigma factor